MVIHNALLFATKCILWQYDALMRSPLDGVNAAPLENNIFEWHGNFYFQEDHEHFPGMVVHFILNLPRDYPNSTPDMRLLNPFPHSHVVGDTICFSLLSHWEWYFKGSPSTAFWNPARTVRSLLESVYIFLTVDEDKHITVSGHSALAALQRAQRTCCHTCGHSSSKAWPPEERWMAAKSASNLEQQVCALAMHQDLVDKELPPKKPPAKREVLRTLPEKAVVVEITDKTMVLFKVPAPDLISSDFDARVSTLKAKAETMIASAPSTLRTWALDSEALEDFRCSITGITFDHSDKVVLGFGVNVKRRHNNGTILSITTDLIPISMEVFTKGNIRKSALGAEITHFFPFAINEAHWEKAKLVLPGCVNAILKGSQEHNLSDRPEDRLLFVVGELWKSMAVLMMNGEAHASEKVLKGFCALHHILLFATEEKDPFDGLLDPLEAITAADCAKDEECAVESKSEANCRTPESDWEVVVHRKNHRKKHSRAQESDMLRLANTKVNAFVKYPSGRHKSNCPDFGRFLPLILLSDLSWKEIKEPFVHELLARNARWVVQAHQGLRKVQQSEKNMLSARAEKSWEASSTGLKLTAFQIRFALNVLPWARQALPKPLFEAYEKAGNQRLLIRAMYNALGGRPRKEMLTLFQHEAKAIEGMRKYEQFFQSVEMNLGKLEIQKMLCDAMQRSEKCRYHR